MAKTPAKRTRRAAPRARPAAKSEKPGASPDDVLAEVMRLMPTQGVAKVLPAIEMILKAQPDHWPTIKYRWQLLWSLGQFALAIEAGKDALARAARSIEIQEDLACHFLGFALEKAREDSKFSSHVNSIVDLAIIMAGHPRMSGALQIALQNALGAMRRHAEGLRLGMVGLELYPRFAGVFHHNNSFHLYELGRHEEAVASFGRKLAPFTGKAKRANIARQYDAGTAAYDSDGPHQSHARMMAQLIVKTAGATANKRILDAGCGAGSLAAHVRAAHMVGIDLSPKMLAKARERKIYQELIKGDLVATMAKRGDRFDIVAATRVLHHVADLAPFFRQAARLLVPGGHLFFTVDPAPDSKDIGVGNPGEYAHSRSYVRRLAAKAFTEISVRIMPHRGNPGFWWAFGRRT